MGDGGSEEQIESTEKARRWQEDQGLTRCPFIAQGLICMLVAQLISRTGKGSEDIPISPALTLETPALPVPVLCGH